MRFYILKLGTYSSKTKKINKNKRIPKNFYQDYERDEKEFKHLEGKKVLPALDDSLKRILSYFI